MDTIGWSLSPMTGPALAQGAELEQKRFDADFYAELHEAARYESMTTIEKTDFDGPAVLQGAAGAARRRRGVRVLRRRERAQGRLDRDARQPDGTDHRDQHRGRLQAVRAAAPGDDAQVDGHGAEQLVTLTSIEYDTVSPSTFEPPAAIKALVK